MVDFLMNSELTESKAFKRSFVKEISVAPDTATIHYTIPMPEDIAVPGKAALGGAVRSTVHRGTPGGTRTHAPGSGGQCSIL